MQRTQQSQGTTRPSRRLAATASAALSMAMLMTNLFTLAHAAPDIPEALGPNTLIGTVTLDSGGGVPNARVIAIQSSSRRAATTANTGNYLMSGLITGTYSVNVVPVTITTTSPTWVYTGGAQLIDFASAPLTQTLNFTAAHATAVIAGNIMAPDGSTNFGAGNRVWVRAANQEGQGNTVQVDPSTGAFSVNVLPGNTLLHLTMENSDWTAPATLAGSMWFVDTGGVIQPSPVGTIQLLQDKDIITGSVLDENGQPVSSPVTVRAWRVDGSEVATTETISGSYTLKVITGTWDIWAAPDVNSPYVSVQFADPVVFTADNLTKTRVLRVATADVTVNGTFVDNTNVPITSLNFGRALAMRRDALGHWQQLGQGTSIKSGAFTMKLASSAADVYQIRGLLPPQAGFTALASPTVTVSAGQTYTIRIPTSPDNSTITGTFETQAGAPATNLPGIVYGTSDRSAEQNARVNPLTAQYKLNVASTDLTGHGGTFWQLYGFVDPTSGWVVQRSRDQRVFLPYNNGNGSNVSADFTVAQLNSTVKGVVTSAQGTPVAGAIVHVQQVYATGLDAFRQWAITRADGSYRVRVPAGTYRVRASSDHLIQPVPQVVTASANGSVTANLQFRDKNATIAGQVTYNGIGYPAFVRAYSDSGAHVWGLTGPLGGYALSVNSGDVWHVQGVGETHVVSVGITTTLFLLSPRVAVTPTAGLNNGVNLALVEHDALPEAVAFRFDATQDQAIVLSNGAQVVAPAGALADSGNVTLYVRPLKELADDGGAQPVSFGYRLYAFDDSHLPITHFNAPVTLKIPFTAAQLTALGVTADQLVPQYWDMATNSWKPIPNASVQTDTSGDGFVNISVEHFTDFALMTARGSTQVFVPVISK